MILEVKIKNIFSFDKETTFKFDNVTIINGPNNSGKTSFLKILDIVSRMVRNDDNFDNIPLNSYAYNKELCSFEITFTFDNNKYTYGFSCNRKEIVKEYLYCDELKVFVRDNINKYSFNKKDKRLIKLSNNVSSNRLFISYFEDSNYIYLSDAYNFLSINLGVVLSVTSLFDLAFRIYERDSNHELKKYILDFFKKSSINIIDYKVSTLLINGNKAYKTKFKHSSFNKIYIIDYGDESLSIRVIFALLPFILMAIDSNRTLLIDDLDRYLDSNIISLLIEYFKNEEGQLVFCSHNDYDYGFSEIKLKNT